VGSVVFEVLRPVLPMEEFSSVMVCCRVIAVSFGWVSWRGSYFLVDGVELHSWSSWLFLGVFDLGLVFLIVYCRIFAARFCLVDMVVEVHSCVTSELRLVSTCVFWWDVFIRAFV
jgi:hypothetical protein